ncbi:hypothetical protein OXX79_006151 [Metschnikowia pulcherrima]
MEFHHPVNGNGSEISVGLENDEFGRSPNQPQKRLASGLALALGLLMLVSFVFTLILINGTSPGDHVGYNWHAFGAGYGMTFFLLVAKGAFYTDFSNYVPESMLRRLGIRSNILHGLLAYVLMTLVVSCVIGYFLEKILG